MKLLTKKQQQSYEHFEENFKEKYTKDKKYCKVWNHCCYTGEYRGAPHSICNLTFSVPNEMSKVFHNGSDCDYHFIIKELAKKIEGQFTSLGKIPKNTRPFLFLKKKKLQELTKMEKKSPTLYLTDYNLLIAQDLWQTYYQVSLIILLKEFIKLNVKINIIKNNAKNVELNTKIATAFLNTQTLKMI